MTKFRGAGPRVRAPRATHKALTDKFEIEKKTKQEAAKTWKKEKEKQITRGLLRLGSHRGVLGTTPGPMDAQSLLHILPVLPHNHRTKVRG